MGYATLSLARKLAGIPQDVQEEDFTDTLTLADNYMINDISVKVKGEVPFGNIDAGNKDFYLSNFPIADANLDKVVDSKDIAVWFWSDGTDVGTRVLQATTTYSLDGDLGKISLATAPSTETVDKISVDYSYYHNTVTLSMLEAAASILAAAYYSMYEYSLLPTDIGLGTIRYRRRYEPFEKLFDEYYRLRDRIITTPQRDILPEEQPDASPDTRSYRLKRREDIGKQVST